ncbi:hypothetical protein ACFSTI_23610 [Rhizorhabdus histidinilytica]
MTRYGSNRLECVIGRGDRTQAGFVSTVDRTPAWSNCWRSNGATIRPGQGARSPS